MCPLLLEVYIEAQVLTKLKVRTRSIVDFIQKACDRQLTHLLLVGDFNYNDINWEALVSQAPLLSHLRSS